MTPEEQKEFDELEAAEKAESLSSEEKNEQASNDELANHNAEKESHDIANQMTIEKLRAHLAEGEINADIENESPASEGSAELLDHEQMYEVIKRTSYINATGNIIFLELGDSISGDLITQEYLDSKLVQKVTPILEE